MDNQKHSVSRLREPGHIATITVIVLAYVVTFVGYLSSLRNETGPLFSTATLLLATALGIVYLWLFLDGNRLLEPLFGRYATAVFFGLAIGLMLTIEFLLEGYGGIWLIAMPLVATAVTELSPRWRWLVYAIVIVGMTVPIYLASGEWRSALLALLTFSPALVFVVVFVRLTQRAEVAQKESEELAAELEVANQQLATYAVQIEELATTQERNRLAREIHDNLGHYLTVVNVQIKAALAVMDKDPEHAKVSLTKAQQLTQEGLDAVRQSVSALRDSPLGGRTLAEALDDLALETQVAGVMCSAKVLGSPRSLDPRLNLTLYRTAQEALTNARKHARAARVDVLLDYRTPDQITLTISDDGIGALHVEDDQRFGLLGMRERVRQLGGVLSIETAPGNGFSLTVTLPTVGTATQLEVNSPPATLPETMRTGGAD